MTLPMDVSQAWKSADDTQRVDICRIWHAAGEAEGIA